MTLLKILHRLSPFLFIIFLIIIFFNKTLIGEEMFVTPDWGQSDILYAGYAPKFFTSQSLKNHELTFWNPRVGTGYPQLSAIDGVFNPINFLVYYLLPMPLAYNINLALIFLITATFTYLYTKTLKLSSISSLMASVTFSFSGIFVTKIVHISVIQTLSYFPIGLYLLEKALQEKKLSILILLAFAVDFQMLTGFYQIVLYSLIVYIFYCFFRLQNLKEKMTYKVKFFIIFLLVLFLGFFMGSIQLFPTWEFTKLSTRSLGVTGDDIKMFPYPIYHLITFIWPYLLGDPRIGGYPIFSENWGIFWENTGYIGMLPLIFAGGAIINLFKKNKTVKLFSIIAFISIFLMFGFGSLTFFMYLFPPLSLFRVPARWIIFLVFSLCILAAIGFEEFKQKVMPVIIPKKFVNFISLIILILITLNIFIFIQNYHLRGRIKDWLKPTQTVQFLRQDKTLFRIQTIGNGIVWNEQMGNRGWMGAEKKFMTFNEALTPFWNTIFAIDHVDSYPVILTQRNNLMREINLLGIRLMNNEIYLNDLTKKLLDLQNVKYIIAPFIINSKDLEKVYSTSTSPIYNIYQNKSVFPRAYAVYQYAIISTVGNYLQLLADPTFELQKNVVLEKTVPLKQSQENPTAVEIVTYENQLVEIKANMIHDGLLVFADALYPSWKAYVDGREAEILTANINQRAVVVPKGSHVIKFIFESASFQLGAIISIISMVLTISLFIYFGYHNTIIKKIIKLRR